VAFSSILGHARVKALLAQALAKNRLPPTLMFTGPEGVGKRTLALAAGRAILCERQDGDSCLVCGACRRALKGLHPDLIVAQAQGSAIKIDQIREVAREIGGRPFESSGRAVLIDGAHLLTEEAANALLKSLEEPPPTSHVFLVTSAPQALPPTIRSRCQVLRLGPLPEALLEDHLVNSLGMSHSEARLRVSVSGGSLGAALAFESDAYKTLRDEILTFLEKLGEAGPLERLDAAEHLAELEDPLLALTALRSLLRDVVALRVARPSGRVLNADLGERLLDLSTGVVGERAMEFAEAAGEARGAFRANANKLLTMDLLLNSMSPPIDP